MHRALEDGRRERLAVLDAVEAALADPVRLIGLLREAADDEDAIGRVQQEFGLDRVPAEAVLDAQFRRLNRANQARTAEELGVLRAEWGPPLQASVRFRSRRSAVLSVDGVEHSFRAGGPQSVLSLVEQFALAQVARPRLRPVVVTVTGLPDGPARLTLTPAGDGGYEYPDDPAAPEGRR